MTAPPTTAPAAPDSRDELTRLVLVWQQRTREAQKARREAEDQLAEARRTLVATVRAARSVAEIADRWDELNDAIARELGGEGEGA